MKTFLAFASIALILASCSSDDDNQPVDSNPKNQIRLNNLKAGQISYFRVFDGQCSSAPQLNFSGDTVMLEVISQNENLYFRESYTEHSPITQVIDYIPPVYPVFPENGYILIPERSNSWLFFFFGNDTLPVSKPANVNLKQGDCLVEYLDGQPFIGEEIGQMPNFQIGEVQESNKRIVSCVPPFLALDAYLVFDSRELGISMSISQFGEGYEYRGFELIAK